jgi:hypothetical protein
VSTGLGFAAPSPPAARVAPLLTLALPAPVSPAHSPTVRLERRFTRSPALVGPSLEFPKWSASVYSPARPLPAAAPVGCEYTLSRALGRPVTHAVTASNAGPSITYAHTVPHGDVC